MCMCVYVHSDRMRQHFCVPQQKVLRCQPEIFSSLFSSNPGHVPWRLLARHASRALAAVFIYRPQTPSRIIYATGWVQTNCVQYVASHPAFSSPAVCVTFQSLIALRITWFSLLAVQYLRLNVKLLSSNFLYKAYLLIHGLRYVFVSCGQPKKYCI